MGHHGAWAPGWNTVSFRYVDKYIYLGYVYLRYIGDTYDFGYAQHGVYIPNIYTYLNYLYVYI